MSIDLKSFISNPQKFQQDILDEQLQFSLDEITEKTILARDNQFQIILQNQFKTIQNSWENLLASSDTNQNFSNLAETFKQNNIVNLKSSINSIKNENIKNQFLLELDNINKQITASAIRKDYKNSLVNYSETLKDQGNLFEQSLKSGDLDSIKNSGNNYLDSIKQAYNSGLMEETKYASSVFDISEKLKKASFNYILNQSDIVGMEQGYAHKLEYLNNQYENIQKLAEKDKNFELSQKQKLVFLTEIEKTKQYIQKASSEDIEYGREIEEQLIREKQVLNSNINDRLYEGEVGVVEANQAIQNEIDLRKKHFKKLSSASREPRKAKIKNLRTVKKLENKKKFNLAFSENTEVFLNDFKNETIGNILNFITGNDPNKVTEELFNDIELFATDTKKLMFGDDYKINPDSAMNLVEYFASQNKLDGKITAEVEEITKLYPADEKDFEQLNEIGQSLKIQNLYGQDLPGLTSDQQTTYKDIIVKGLGRKNSVENKLRFFRSILNFTSNLGSSDVLNKLFKIENNSEKAIYDAIQVFNNARDVPALFDNLTMSFVNLLANPEDVLMKDVVKSLDNLKGLDYIYKKLNPASVEGGKYVTGLLLSEQLRKNNFESISLDSPRQIKNILSNVEGLDEYLTRRVDLDNVSYIRKDKYKEDQFDNTFKFLDRILSHNLYGVPSIPGVLVAKGLVKTAEFYSNAFNNILYGSDYRKQRKIYSLLDKSIDEFTVSEGIQSLIDVAPFIYSRKRSLINTTEFILDNIITEFNKTKRINPVNLNREENYKIVDNVLQVRTGRTNKYTDVIFWENGTKKRVVFNPEKMQEILYDSEKRRYLKDSKSIRRKLVLDVFTLPDKIKNNILNHD